MLPKVDMSSRLSAQFRQAPTRYKPLSRIAVGGMAEVWRAEASFESGGHHEVAIKRVLPQMGDEMYRAMFEDEARLGMLLDHENIVRVYDARSIGETYIMVMELVDGDALKGILERAHRRQACMPVPTALFIARALARSLAYVHQARDDKGAPLGIVHRDVSPHNLLLGKDGSVKLTDFGLADASVHAHVRSEDMVGGKIGYLAPEIVLRQPMDHRIDLFAAGICLWEMLAGRRLFQGADEGETVRMLARCEIPSLQRINGRVTPEVDALVAKMLAKNPEERFLDGAAMVAALDDAIERMDRNVSAKDIALVVGLHLAQEGREKPAKPTLAELGVAELLAQELDEFAQAAQVGQVALDPNEFALGITSGVRRNPLYRNDD